MHVDAPTVDESPRSQDVFALAAFVPLLFHKKFHFVGNKRNFNSNYINILIDRLITSDFFDSTLISCQFRLECLVFL